MLGFVAFTADEQRIGFTSIHTSREVAHNNTWKELTEQVLRQSVNRCPNIELLHLPPTTCTLLPTT